MEFSLIPRRLRKPLKYGLAFLGCIVVLSVVYLGAALILELVPVNTAFRDAENGTEVYLVSNGIHVDFVLPIQTRLIDFSELLPYRQFAGVDSSHRYIFFGWGDRSFYIETPDWHGVSLSTVAEAMLLPTAAVMHVQYTRNKPEVSESTRRVLLSNEQYETLVRLIRDSFQTDEAGEFKLIRGKGYGDADNFYAGAGTYHAFSTCNMWTNRLLKKPE